MDLEDGRRRLAGKAEEFERLMPAPEAKLSGLRELVCVRDRADWNRSAKRDASPQAGYFKQSGIHAAEEAGS